MTTKGSRMRSVIEDVSAHDATSQPSGHESEPDKQEQPCSPNDVWFAAVGPLREQALLVNQVDDEKT